MMQRTQDHGEVELKFELDGRAAKEVRRHGVLAEAAHQTHSQTSVYFDTIKGEIHKAGYSLRVRQVGDCFTQTVKTNGGAAGLFDRGEWEAPVEQMVPDRKALDRTPLRKLKNLDRRAEPVVCSDVDRTTWLIDRDGSVIEAVLDSGTVSAGEEEAKFHELELELKAGESKALFDFAQELSKAVVLEVGVLSKEERGLMLAKGAFGRAHKASDLDIATSMDAGEAFASIVHECIRHFRLNEPLIVAERDPEALHQARVALRRLRTAFSLFRPAIRQASLEPLRNELREFLTPFGEARNLDVFLGRLGGDLAWRDRRKLTSARDEAYDQIVDTLKEQRSRDMLLDLVEWTTSEDWRKEAALTPILKFAAPRLDAVWRKVKRKGARLGDLEERQLHRLRINVKKLRYAVDFLAPLYDKKRVRKFASSLEEMQDCLGLIHDDMVSREIVADFALGETGRTDVTDRSRQLKTMETRFKQVKRVGRFWNN
jgi:inorganic triphosphatase YgiF